MIHILHVIDSLDLGGAQTVILQIARQMDRSRFSMEVAVMHGRGFFTESLEKEGIRVHSLSGNKFPPTYIPKFLKLAHGNRFQIFHFHLFGANWIAKPLAALLGHRHLIAHDHCNDLYRSEKPLHIAIDRFTNRFASKIVAVSKSTEDFLTKVEKIDPSKVTYLANGVDTTRFQPATQEKRSACRQKLGLPQDAIVIGGVGRLHPQKNFSLFLDVAALLRDQTNVHFVIAGTGPEETMLRRKAVSLGLDKQIHFAGLVSDMPDFYAALDGLLLTSRYEGMPITVLEAMASGLFVVGSDLDGVKEVISDGVNGYLVNPNSAPDFVSRLNSLIASTDVRRTVGNAARRHVETHFAIESMVSTLERLYLQEMKNDESTV
ncbi:MAG: glycosyltransferase [Chthoniobacterales bacterium]